MPDPYESISDALRHSGFYVTSTEKMGDWSRIVVCSRKREDFGYTGNSCWLTYLGESWYVGTWGGVIYQLPNACRLNELCMTFLSREVKQLEADIDEVTRKDFDLREVSDDDFDAAAGESTQ